MSSCRHHSGYLADDEAGHTTYLARVQPPKKSAFPKMGQASKPSHMPHPPSMCGPSGSSGLRNHCRNSRGPQPFGSFLDFLVEGQVLDSLQRVVEEATERIATMKTETGVPLVEVQDPVEVPRGGRRVRARPSLSTVHRHQVRPSLCIGHPNNYPSCSSSMSDSHNSTIADWPNSHSRDSDLGYQGLGPLPPTRDRLLQEKSLKRLLRLENRGKSLGKSCSQRDSLLWDSLGSSMGMPKASELGPGERELTFLRRELNKEIKSLLRQPESFNLPGYSSLHEPHRTIDFLAKHHLYPALQSVVSQAVDKLTGALCHDGCPLFPSEGKPSTEPNSGFKQAIPTKGEEPYDLPTTTTPGFKMVGRKNTKSRVRERLKGGGFPMSSAQGVTRFRLQVIPTEEPKVPSPHSRQEAPDQDPKEDTPPMFSSGPQSSSQKAQPWRSLHLTLPAPGTKVEVPSHTHLTQSNNYKFMKKTTLPSISKSMSHFSNPWYEELVNYLVEQAVSLLVCKYKYKRNLTKQLGFISFPVTETLTNLLLGFKKVKGSDICLSSDVNWSCLLRKLEETQRAQKTSQHDTSHHTDSHQDTTHQGTSLNTTESLSTLPMSATVMDQKVEELPGPQLPSPLEDSTDKEQGPTNPVKPKFSLSYSAGMSPNQFEQAVDMGESEKSEEEEDDEDYKTEGMRKTQSTLEPQVSATLQMAPETPHDSP
ncbi:coiled-coil domain-containing protein 116 [Molossus molossus]|uniref:Coiled-coil domain containing 116 n=1 Tax=Molossus molossus TaxID=27622 RepID=A0A7J8BWJ0_MOLMO|nr:coiled-coil domain-containing protein 116 [Molossus molossus]KAF6403134.1 coiled-coil domain containing 116 [Molossus molossus]